MLTWAGVYLLTHAKEGSGWVQNCGRGASSLGVLPYPDTRDRNEGSRAQTDRLPSPQEG